MLPEGTRGTAVNIKLQNTDVLFYLNVILLGRQDVFSASAVGARRTQQHVFETMD